MEEKNSRRNGSGFGLGLVMWVEGWDGRGRLGRGGRKMTRGGGGVVLIVCELELWWERRRRRLRERENPSRRFESRSERK